MRRAGRPRWAWAVILLTVAAGAARGQLVAVSAKPVRGWVENLREIARIALPPEVFQQLNEGLGQVAGPDGLAGLDPEKSWGAFADLPKGNESPLVVIVLPVTDGRAFLESLKRLGLGVDEPPDAKTFTHLLTLPDGVTRLFVHTRPGHLYLTPFPTAPERLEAVKPALLDSLRPKSSELTVAVRLDQLPQEVADAFANQFKLTVDAKADREPGEEEARFIGRKLAQDLGRSGVLALVRDAKELALDLNLDPKTGPIGLEMRLTAKPGSPTAKAFDAFGSGRSVFRGLGDGAVLDALGVLPLDEEVRKAFGGLVKLAREDSAAKLKDRPEAERKSAGDALNFLERVLTAPAVDLAMSLKGPYDGSKFALVMGLKVDDPADLDRSIRGAPGGPIKFDVAKGRDGKTSIHRIDAAASGRTEPDRMLGKMDVHLALAGRVVLVSVGDQGLRAIQDALAQVAEPARASAPQLELRFAFGKIMAFANSEAERKAGEEAAKSAFAGGDAGKDVLSLAVSGKDGALRIRLGGDVVLLKFVMRLGMLTETKIKP